MSATGSVIYRDASGNVEELLIGNAGDILTVGGSSIPIWQAPSVVLTNIFDYFNPADGVFGGINGFTGIAGIGVRNKRPILEFFDNAQAPTEDEQIVFAAVMSTDFDPAAKNLEVHIDWAGPAAVVVGDVKWDVAFERIEQDVDDIDVDSFATARSVVDPTAGTTGFTSRAVIDFTSAQADGLLAGEDYRLQVIRDSDDVTDTLVGDADIIRVSIVEVDK
jgi:hypothetical protein